MMVVKAEEVGEPKKEKTVEEFKREAQRMILRKKKSL